MISAVRDWRTCFHHPHVQTCYITAHGSRLSSLVYKCLNDKLEKTTMAIDTK